MKQRNTDYYNHYVAVKCCLLKQLNTDYYTHVQFFVAHSYRKGLLFLLVKQPDK